MPSPLTVITCTIGDSAWYVRSLLRDLRRFTSLPFGLIVCDDGTQNAAAIRRQKSLCEEVGARHVQNPGPWGVAENLDFAWRQCQSDWILVMEDGLRPSRKWLESTATLIEAVDKAKVAGRWISMIGHSTIQDWQAVLAGIIPSRFSAVAWYDNSADYSDDRLRDFFSGVWNDGRITMEQVCRRITSRGLLAYSPRPRDEMRSFLKWTEAYHGENHYPYRDFAEVCWQPGGVIAVRRAALKEAGGFRHGCSQYEAHLGARLAAMGHVSCYLEGPPFLHTPSTGFRSAWKERLERHHTVPRRAFMEDFGTEDLTGFVSKFIEPSTVTELNNWLRALTGLSQQGGSAP